MLPIYLLGLLGAAAIYGVYEWGRDDGQNNSSNSNSEEDAIPQTEEEQLETLSEGESILSFVGAGVGEDGAGAQDSAGFAETTAETTEPDADVSGDSATSGTAGTILSGSMADDNLSGTDGDDVRVGGAGSDTLAGDDGNDILIGGHSGVSAADYPDGGELAELDPETLGSMDVTDDQTADSLSGGEGSDLLFVGGEDSAEGGEDADTFALLDGEAADPARIMDFDAAEDALVYIHDADTPAPELELTENEDGTHSLNADGEVVALLSASALRVEDVVLVERAADGSLLL